MIISILDKKGSKSIFFLKNLYKVQYGKPEVRVTV